MTPLKIVIGVNVGILLTCLWIIPCHSLRLPQATPSTTPVPSVTTNLSEVNGEFSKVEGDNNNQVLIGELVQILCGLEARRKRSSGDDDAEIENVTRMICEGDDNDNHDLEDSASAFKRKNYIPPPPSSEPFRQVIFVEVPEPQIKVVYNPPPPETVVYVLPPEENHEYRVFDMRKGRNVLKPPVVHFLTDFSNSPALGAF